MSEFYVLEDEPRGRSQPWVIGPFESRVAAQSWIDARSDDEKWLFACRIYPGIRP